MLFTDDYEREARAIKQRGYIETAPHAGSLTPVLRKLGHTGTYYISHLSGETYRAYRDVLASLGVELLRDERLISYHGTVKCDTYVITLTSAGVRMVEAATRDSLVCPLVHGEWAREYGDYEYGWDMTGPEPIHTGERVDILDLCQGGDCSCGAYLVGSRKSMRCPSCGSIVHGT
jgi:hypothetical protein